MKILHAIPWIFKSVGEHPEILNYLFLVQDSIGKYYPDLHFDTLNKCFNLSQFIKSYNATKIQNVVLLHMIDIIKSCSKDNKSKSFECCLSKKYKILLDMVASFDESFFVLSLDEFLYKFQEACNAKNSIFAVEDYQIFFKIFIVSVYNLFVIYKMAST